MSESVLLMEVKLTKKNQVHSILYIGQQEWQYKIMGLNSLGNDMKNI